MSNKSEKQKGLALLVAMMVAGVSLSIGLSLLETTMMQVRLSSGARDSELAFTASRAASECAQHIRNNNLDDLTSGVSVSANCMGVSTAPVVSPDTPITDVNLYEYDITWGSGASQVCSQIEMYLFDNRGNTSPMSANIPGRSDVTNPSCAAESVCTHVLARGYNRSCTNLTIGRVVERELFVVY